MEVVGVWKFWGPEGMLEPSFLISEGNGTGRVSALPWVTLSHTSLSSCRKGGSEKPEECVPFPQSR